MELLTIDKIREQGYKIIKDVDIVIKPYLPLAVKQFIVKNILELCTIEEAGIKRIDFALKEFAFEFTLVNQYSNIDCNVENVVQLYDELKEHRVIDGIVALIPEAEIEFIEHVLRKEIEQIQLVDNSVSVILAGALNKLIEKFPSDKDWSKIIKELPKQINKINPDKLSFITQAINWNNGGKNA